jgi:hypothetical protein
VNTRLDTRQQHKITNQPLSSTSSFSSHIIAVCPFETKKQLADGLRRRQYDTLDALYFIRPKRTNLGRLCDDFKQEVIEEKKDVLERLFPCILRGIEELAPPPGLYASARLLVLPGPQSRPGIHNWQLAHDWIIGQIQNRGKELEKLSSAYKFEGQETRDCVVEYMAYEDSLFSLDLPDTVSTVYTHQLLAGAGAIDREELENLKGKVYDHLDVVAQRLMTALVAMNEYPYIRYSHSTRGIAEVVANSLKTELKQYRDMHPSFAPWGSAQAREERKEGGPTEPATVIIVDRVDDIVPAVMHDLTYSCVLTDLLDHEPNTPFHFEYTKGGVRVEKDVLLDDSDPVWRSLRYEELPAVMQATEDAFRQMKARAEARKQLDPSDVADLRELMNVLTSDEQHLEEKIAQHYRIKVQACEAYEKRNLSDVRVMEQVLVTGCNDDGSSVDRKVIDATLKELMKDSSIVSEDKTRLLIIYLLCAKVVESKLWKELLSLAELKKTHIEALSHLGDLHVPLQRSASEAKAEGAPFLDPDTLARNKKAAQDTVARNKRAASSSSSSSSSSAAMSGGQEDQTRLVRYITKVEDIIVKHLQGTLSEESYPWVRQPPTRGNKGGGGGGGGGGGDIDFPEIHEASKLGANVAMHGAHGEAINKYVVSALTKDNIPTSAPGGGKKGRFQSKFKGGGGGNDGSGGGGGGSVNTSQIAQDDVESSYNAAMKRYMDPVDKPRLYAAGGRLFVFVVGGVTLTELAAVERLKTSKEIIRGGKDPKEIIVGGTSIITARDMIEQLTLTEPELEYDDDNNRNFGAGVGDMLKEAGGLDDFS